MSARSRDAVPQQGGDARCEGLSYQALLDRDTREVPAVLREVHAPELGSEDIPAELFTSQAVHDLEMERMWCRTWQMVCREEEIPETGDHHVYEIGHLSFIVARTEDGDIKAFYNSCLHRGRQLRDESGSVGEFRCPFHGFTWHLDGRLKEIPCRWDFPHLDERKSRLPEARVGTWGGFVFINMDENAPPLEDYLGVVPEHFSRWPLEHTWKAVHVQKVIGCNWKLGLQAFIESWHSLETHPQILPYTADANSQYDWWGDNVSRTITAMGSPSPHLKECAEQEILDALAHTSGRMSAGDTSAMQIPEGKSAREHMADINRAEFGKLYGMDLSHAADAEVLDAVLYSVFPNFIPWAGYNPNIVYRFRPNGSDCDSSIMDVMILLRLAEGAERPDPVPARRLSADEPWQTATELGALGYIFDQDMGNLPYVQKGLRTTRKGAISLGNYQELRIRHFHRTLDKYLAN